MSDDGPSDEIAPNIISISTELYKKYIYLLAFGLNNHMLSSK